MRTTPANSDEQRRKASRLALQVNVAALLIVGLPTAFYVKKHPGALAPFAHFVLIGSKAVES